MKREKKDEESGGSANPFLNLDKTTVLQEASFSTDEDDDRLCSLARLFNDTPINTKKCCQILTKLMYILMQGETLSRMEATEVFFAVTKLWQSKDATLRRLVYLTIKELSSLADDVIIVTSSLTKDMTGKEDIYRAAAVRALCKITDSSMFQAIDRYMKQAIVDKSPAVASAALVSSLHIMKKNPEIVRRWVNEVQEAVSSDNSMVQYHALIVLYHIRKSDRLAVIKMIQKYSKQSLKSPYAVCYLYFLFSMESVDLFSFLESCLRHKHETVIYEAVTAIVKLPNVTAKEISPAVNVLQLLLSSPRPSMRFAAVRTLNKVAMNYPVAVINCNVDLEQLITDQNRSIATLAITTLLKTGAESSVDRLMKQISSFVSEISDEFKIVVIEAIRSLCLRYPRKHMVMMQFLSTMLREDGGYEYKKEIVDTMIAIVEDNPDAKEAGLSYLCEFIEDCEHFVLATKILHLFGREGSRTAGAKKYIRYIYNRVILENAQVRAAAVSALAKFGAYNEILRPNICVLLTRCLLDSDDEVRDRATFYLTVLLSNNALYVNQYILEGLQVSVVGLEKALQLYCAEPQPKPFDLKSVPLAAQPITASLAEEKRA
uniref:Clathrin/coatomer adaptor adaptin-like N-terminal domain-containing protein n=1 Tax=Romanomermis culicivorax TaxID=13658 RepID=A0A915IAW2_ROMCU